MDARHEDFFRSSHGEGNALTRRQLRGQRVQRAEPRDLILHGMRSPCVQTSVERKRPASSPYAVDDECFPDNHVLSASIRPLLSPQGQKRLRMMNESAVLRSVQSQELQLTPHENTGLQMTKTTSFERENDHLVHVPKLGKVSAGEPMLQLPAGMFGTVPGQAGLLGATPTTSSHHGGASLATTTASFAQISPTHQGAPLGFLDTLFNGIMSPLKKLGIALTGKPREVISEDQKHLQQHHDAGGNHLQFPTQMKEPERRSYEEAPKQPYPSSYNGHPARDWLTGPLAGAREVMARQVAQHSTESASRRHWASAKQLASGRQSTQRSSKKEMDQYRQLVEFGSQGYNFMWRTYKEAEEAFQNSDVFGFLTGQQQVQLLRPHAGASLRPTVDLSRRLPSKSHVQDGVIAKASLKYMKDEQEDVPVWKQLSELVNTPEKVTRSKVLAELTKNKESLLETQGQSFEATQTEARQRKQEMEKRAQAAPLITQPPPPEDDDDIIEVEKPSADEQEREYYDREEEESYEGGEAEEEEEEAAEEEYVPTLELLPLSEEANERIDYVLGPGPEGEELVSHEPSNQIIHRRDIRCLVNGAWLNDEVINLYLALLKEREQRNEGQFPVCHFFNTFFYAKLSDNGKGYNYKSVKRWTRKNNIGYSLKDCDKIIVPVHLGMHWVLAVINMQDRKFVYMDSLGGGGKACLERLARYIVEEIRDKDGEVLDVSDWEYSCPKDIPEQFNTSDCGMFMLKYADYESRNAPLTFSQSQMPDFRRYMVWEILNLYIA